MFCAYNDVRSFPRCVELPVNCSALSCATSFPLPVDILGCLLVVSPFLSKAPFPYPYIDIPIHFRFCFFSFRSHFLIFIWRTCSDSLSYRNLHAVRDCSSAKASRLVMLRSAELHFGSLSKGDTVRELSQASCTPRGFCIQEPCYGSWFVLCHSCSSRNS